MRALRIYSQDIGIEFSIEKCAMLIMKSSKRHITVGMELSNQEKIRTLREKETYKYLSILEADTIKQVEMKEKIEYLRTTRKLLEIKIYSRNLIKGIDTWDISVVRYSVPFLKWIREELKQMDQRTRKRMTMHKAFHLRDDRLYVSVKERGKGPTSIEVRVSTSMQWLKDYIEKLDGKLVTATRKNTDSTRTNGTEITRKQKWE